MSHTHTHLIQNRNNLENTCMYRMCCFRGWVSWRRSHHIPNYSTVLIREFTLSAAKYCAHAPTLTRTRTHTHSLILNLNMSCYANNNKKKFTIAHLSWECERFPPKRGNRAASKLSSRGWILNLWASLGRGERHVAVTRSRSSTDVFVWQTHSTAVEEVNPHPTPSPAAHPQHADRATQLFRWLTKQRHQIMWVLTLPGERRDSFFPQVLRHVFGYKAFLSLLHSLSKFNWIKIFRVKWLPSKTIQTKTR